VICSKKHIDTHIHNKFNIRSILICLLKCLLKRLFLRLLLFVLITPLDHSIESFLIHHPRSDLTSLDSQCFRSERSERISFPDINDSPPLGGQGGRWSVSVARAKERNSYVAFASCELRAGCEATRAALASASAKAYSHRIL